MAGMLIEALEKSGILDGIPRLPDLHGEFNRVLSTGHLPWSGEYPELNIYAGKDAVKIVAFVPGTDADKIDVSVEGNRLSIAGEFPVDEAEGYACFRRERSYGEFSRGVRLPFRAKSEDVTANYSKGILTITVNRPEEDKPHTITIKSE